MKRYQIAAFGLGALILLLLLLTRFNSPTLRSDTITVELGFAVSPSERVQAFDETLLAVLERGSFNDELRQRLDRSAHTTQIQRLWVDTCEVKQIDFERFARWQHRSGAVPTAPGALHSSSSGHRIAGLLHSPASGVNYAGAVAYCAAAGGRLPWAEEWEAIAVGGSGRLYPWGDIFDDAFWPYQDAYRNAAQPCGTHPAAATAAGVHDLVNNVMEWSHGQQQAHPLERRPGAHGAPAIRASGRALYALSAAWLEIEARTRSHHLGFRCVYEQPPQLPTQWGATTKLAVLPAGEYSLGIPPDLRLARVAVLLPATQQRNARRLVAQTQTRQLTVTQCEVSRDDYREFLQHPLVRLGLFANQHEPRGQDYTPHNWQQQLEQPELPVSGVNWWAADAFARWAGGRLPRVEEWQLLAAGADANRYPWGNDYEAGIAADDPPQSGARRCGTASHDRTASGIHDLGGNVSEWTLSVTAEQGDYLAWVQGGNWLLPGDPTAQSVFGRLVSLGRKSPTIGFRVVYD